MGKSWGVLLGLLGAQVCVCGLAFGQGDAQRTYYSRKNTFSLFGEYSPDSSHILIGSAYQRTLTAAGAAYARRVMLNRFVDGQYLVEFRPFMLESDPVTVNAITETFTGVPPPFPIPPPHTYEDVAQSCKPGVQVQTFTNNQGTTFVYTDHASCKTQWTVGQGLSPFGFKANFAPRHRIQPVATALLGYMLTTQPIPTPDAGSFNFTIEIGAGVEIYQSADRSKHRSIRAEYRYHHISNKNTAQQNPGIDMGLFQLSYSFGR